MAETVTASRRETDGRTVATRGAVALVVALVGNGILTLAADAVGVAPALMALSLGPVAIFTTAGVVGATVTYWLLARWVDDPDLTFAGIALVVLVLSLLPDVFVIPAEPGGTVAAGVVLGAMHVLTAAVCVVLLTDVGDRW